MPIIAQFFALCGLLGFSQVHLITGEREQCIKHENWFNKIVHSEKALDVFYFSNDTKETIQLTWAGENSGVLILVTMSESDVAPGLASDIYRSDNNGKTFIRITHQFGEEVYIRRENGLQRHQNQRDSKELFVICYDIFNTSRSIMFVTVDGGASWEKSNLPFVLSGQLRFYPRKRLSPWILTLEEESASLFLSLDNGKIWTKIHDDVKDYFWSVHLEDRDGTFYVLYNPNRDQNENSSRTLVKSADFGHTWIHIMDRVVRVWAPRGIETRIKTDSYDVGSREGEVDNTGEDYSIGVGRSRKFGRFLYISHHDNDANHTVKLSVSKDGGKSFEPVYLPLIQSERFYSVLEVEDDLAFVHVDAPNDTGYGTLFTSDISGRIFSESLRQHLYPNHAPVTDFYRVASMRGTYLATRLNPDRTLHTVITHDRGGSWRALGAPLNVEDACKNEDNADSGSSSTTPVQTSKSSFIANLVTLNDSMSTANFDSLAPGIVNNESIPDDPSAIKVCGLQISNQFSIRNRVISFSPLSIPAAPGLILAHGHVATHLKITPADVFVSSDGGYTWLKALTGPHHYQIANRGGLLVAVPADTLWPDVLRFSTDEGRCWHTIPLRVGTWKTDQINGTKTIATVRVNDVTLPSKTNHTFITVLKTTSPPARSSLSSQSLNETVVFTGLVTEPGGRAMAAAVYGYGTISQRWRVAVVDFITNNMVNRSCSQEDYETWVPHSSLEGSQDGCLLGIKQFYRRLKKDSFCINEYGMDPLLYTKLCNCTKADFECEYGYHRRIGSLECIKNPNIPPLDHCLLIKNQTETKYYLGYRRIPGDLCVGGWQPPLWNQSIAKLIRACSHEPLVIEHVRDGSSSSSIGLVIGALIIVLIGIALVVSSRSNLQSQLNRCLYAHRWKRLDVNPMRHPSSSVNQTLFWPPLGQENRTPSGQFNGITGRIVRHGSEKRVTFNQTGKNHLPHLTPTRPLFVDRMREHDSDRAILLDPEEIDLPVENAGEMNRDQSMPSVEFNDPLAPPNVTSI